MNFEAKFLEWGALPGWRAEIRRKKKRLVATNGCFDLLHAGHVSYLQNARRLGHALLVGLNDDDSVRQLKGRNRPLNPVRDRAAVLAALESVDAVCIFSGVRATRFLELAEPDIYVKGGDYTLETLNQEERGLIEKAGGEIVIIPVVPGKSTTALLRKISQL